MSHRLECGMPTTGVRMAVVVQVGAGSRTRLRGEVSTCADPRAYLYLLPGVPLAYINQFSPC